MAPAAPCTPAPLLTPRQTARLDTLFADDAHVEVEATYGVYQQMITAYREPDRVKGRSLMVKLIKSLSSGVPGALKEVITLGRTLNKRAGDILAYFDHPRTSNGPTSDQRPAEHLRDPPGSKPHQHVAHSLPETGDSDPPHPDCESQ